MTYIIYTDDVKYLLDEAKCIKNNDPKLGDIGAYSKIPLEELTHVTIYQGRRRLEPYRNAIPYMHIVHAKCICKPNVLKQWMEAHPQYSSLLLEVEQRIVDKMPEYADTIREVNSGTELYPHNIYSMPSEAFEEYRNWLLWALSLVNLPDKDKVGSLLAERLFTIWMKHNEKKYTHESVNTWLYDKVTGKLINTTDGVA